MSKIESPQIHYTHPEHFPYEWCNAWGEDRSGIWVEFYVPFGEKKQEKIKQRMRWINPGWFMMGSPESQKERESWGKETLHKVTISKGFWLADTACTQELWEAVMGENPSNFKGPKRPVEQVSWNNCKEFLNRINRMIPGISLCLPTEAQWEYACRAETATPFSFGDQITSEQVNFNGTYPYAGGKISSYRGETVDVKSLLPNAWMLYEMHGTVWEWCEDWYTIDLGSVDAVDPVGPGTGEDRVVRGGSWFDEAGICRSACRVDSRPTDRGNIGFRLSRGQGELRQAEQK